MGNIRTIHLEWKYNDGPRNLMCFFEMQLSKKQKQNKNTQKKSSLALNQIYTIYF